MNPLASPLYVAPNDTVAIPPANQQTQNTQSVLCGKSAIRSMTAQLANTPPWLIALAGIGLYKMIAK